MLNWLLLYCIYVPLYYITGGSTEFIARSRCLKSNKWYWKLDSCKLSELITYAIWYKTLPVDFLEHHIELLKDRDCTNIPGNSLAHSYVQKYYAPLDFPLWGYQLDGFRTVTHTAANYNTLPKGFDKEYPILFITYDLNGFTPAHWYVVNNVLPLDFPNWHLEDRYKRTIAHWANQHGTLPEGFSGQYPIMRNLPDYGGDTVLDLLGRYTKKTMFNGNINRISFI